MSIATATAPVKTRARKKPERYVSWLTRLATGAGILQIKLKHSETRIETDRYFVKPIDHDFGGPAFVLERWDDATDDHPAQVGAVYHTRLPGGGEPGYCDCKGHEKFGYCKHRDAIQKLVDDGKL